MTIFERIHDGLQAISKGDVVRLATKPALMGRVRELVESCSTVRYAPGQSADMPTVISIVLLLHYANLVPPFQYALYAAEFLRPV